MKNYLIDFVKGILIGIANVIPGVSGGTIALITGILERLLNAIKNILSPSSLKLFFGAKYKEWANVIDFKFVLAVFLGVIVAIISVARLFKFLFDYYPVHLWAFFFGLVAASIYFVLLDVRQRNIINTIFLIIGTTIAITIALIHPASQNSNVIYLIICGIIATSAMILPGISGSFVLILMGNYELIMIDAINNFNLNILLPVALGAIIGLIALSHILSWLFKRFPDQIISLLSGFMMGSLLIIWPWKESIYKIKANGEYLLTPSGEKIVEKYRWFFPSEFNIETILAIIFMALGIVLIWILETSTKKQKTV